MSGNVIDKAMDRLARTGLNQDGTYGDRSRGDTPLCIIGALKWAGETVERGLAARNLVRDEIRLETGDPNALIPTWNDRASTSLEDVLLVMKKASARLDEASA